MYWIVWEFEVDPDQVPAFEREYGGGGAWTQLFRSSAGYRGTRLWCEVGNPGRYLTLDQWSVRADFDRFMAERGAEYQALDDRLRRLSRSQRRVGEFDGPAGGAGSWWPQNGVEV